MYGTLAYTHVYSKDVTFVPWAKGNKKIQGLHGIETIEIAKKPKLILEHRSEHAL